MTTSGSPSYPTDLYRCLACDHEGLVEAWDRLYCPRCGQLYPLLSSRAVDFLGALPRPRSLSPAQSIAHLPGFAWSYDHLWRPWALSLLTGEPFDASREAQVLRELLGEATPVLDLGTTGGYWSRLLLRAAPERQILGLDLSAGVLEEAARCSDPAWTHYSLLRAPAERLPLVSGSLGAVISGASLNEIPLEPALQEIARVLRPGGILVTLHSQPDPGWGEGIQQILKLTGLQFPSRAQLEAACTAAGLRLDRYLSFGPVAWVRVLRT